MALCVADSFAYLYPLNAGEHIAHSTITDTSHNRSIATLLSFPVDGNFNHGPGTTILLPTFYMPDRPNPYISEVRTTPARNALSGFQAETGGCGERSMQKNRVAAAECPLR